jgi:hypothetical protein
VNWRACRAAAAVDRQFSWNKELLALIWCGFQRVFLLKSPQGQRQQLFFS